MKWLVLLGLMFVSSVAFSGTHRVPTGLPVLSNGFFGEGEWTDAVAIRVDDEVVVFAKSSQRYLWIAVRPRVVHTGINLYLAESSDSQRRYHVSSALSEARFEEGAWIEKWEMNRHWVCNKIGMFILEGDRTTSKPEGFEFQFLRSEFSNESVFLALELKRPELSVPSEDDRGRFEGWIELLLSDPQ